MEKRIGTVTLLVTDRSQSAEVNAIISEYQSIILCRQGLPFHGRQVAVISIIVEGLVNEINAMCGKLGRLHGVEAKAYLTSATLTED